MDYEATVWVNDHEVGRHVGGNTPFSFDITAALNHEGNRLTVKVNDSTEGYQLNGKQVLKPGAITYTRVSGIWQTVWLEQVPERYVEDLDFETLVESVKPEGVAEDSIELRQKVSMVIRSKLAGAAVAGESLRVAVSHKGKEIAVGKGGDKLTIVIPEPLWWTPDTPNLYDLQVELLDGTGKVIDTVKSYTALRTVETSSGTGGRMQVKLNGKEIFLYGPLDQGWWPDGLLTPPSEEAMVADLEYIKAAGFNMVRKHVKVENSRYYYHCDRLGLAVWQDQVSAGRAGNGIDSKICPPWTRMAPDPKDAVWPEDQKKQWIKEYKEMVDHLRDHPSVLIWSLFNEAWGQHDSMELGKMAMDYDPTRLICIASGGNFWPVGHIASHHNYNAPAFPVGDPRFVDYIMACGEMGGYPLRIEGHLYKPEEKKWGYGGKGGSVEQWKGRYSLVVQQLQALKNQGLAIGVYTQTSDVENEINGLLTYDRVPKVPASWLKQANERLMK